MGCASCGIQTNSKPGGCGSSGGCSTGGCNRMNTFDWFADMPISFQDNFNVVEVSFKHGMHKSFYRNTDRLDLHKGDMVVVEAAQGYDIGEVSLKGELVKLQMKKKDVKDRSDTVRNILRTATPEDMQSLALARSLEKDSLVRGRAIARQLKLDMKIGDVEYQGDAKKVTFYYTAEGRVDFRELVKVYAREFKVKIEMRQIGARQEAARIGGIGSCGRELCCSTWLNDFATVTTGAARYQSLSLNTDKLSGQCGRLKCCLNYELDTYMDAVKGIPQDVDKIETIEGVAFLRKTDIFKREMWFAAPNSKIVYRLPVEEVKDIVAKMKKGIKLQNLDDFIPEEEEEEKEAKYEELVGHVDLATLEKKEARSRRKGRGGRSNRSGGNSNPKSAATGTPNSGNRPKPKNPGNMQSKQGGQPAQKSGGQQAHKPGNKPKQQGGPSDKKSSDKPAGPPNNS